MALILFLALIEILTYRVIKQVLKERSRAFYHFILAINILLSIWLWALWIRMISFGGAYDQPENIWSITCFHGMLSGVVLPRTLLIIFHFSGILAGRKTGESYNKILTGSGFIISGLLFTIVVLGSVKGRFRFLTEYQDVGIKGLKDDLEGLRIVHISDIHLPSFYHHDNLLEKLMKEINELDPDIVCNTGDFITVGWREFRRSDTILSIARGRYGNFAVLGNHDHGTYHPHFTEAEQENNVNIMKRLITASGYTVLDDEFEMVEIGDAKVALIGVKTKGSFSKITHGNLKKASERIYGEDLKILLAHDPNQWDEDVTGKTGINITLSGHTHGMQLGIYTKKFKWSPAAFFYPRWNGLYKSGNQYLIVNRGLGVLGMPFRICMPPEITVITLRKDHD